MSDLAKRDPFEPSSIDEAILLAKHLHRGGVLPRSVSMPETAFAIIVAGNELGLSPMVALRSLHIVDGKLTMSADLMLALVKRSPACKHFRLVASTERIATYETLRNGDPSPTSMSFSIEDAQRASLLGKDNWRKYPAAMLRARCVAALARAVYPDLLLGVYTPDELDRDPAGPVEITVVPAKCDEPPAAEPDVPDVDANVLSALLESLAEAADVAAVDAIVKRAVAARRRGDVSEQGIAVLKAAVKNRREAIVPVAAEPSSDEAAQ